jgi:hypothetical protein
MAFNSLSSRAHRTRVSSWQRPFVADFFEPSPIGENRKNVRSPSPSFFRHLSDCRFDLPIARNKALELHYRKSISYIVGQTPAMPLPQNELHRGRTLWVDTVRNLAPENWVKRLG